eukprot:NODE_124_length_18806_cov_0.323996.p9 type:complete len:231 gc:universal NODE_124_length_18806_cov_0.323996:13623-12931(-)
MSSTIMYYLSDSAFPSGGFCFSNGVEVMKNIGSIAELEPFIIDLLKQSGTELPFVSMAFDNSEKLAFLVELSYAYSILNINDVKLNSSRKQGKSYYLSVCKCFFKDSKHYIHTLRGEFDNGLHPYMPCIFGIFAKQYGLSKRDALFLFLLFFLKGVVNAAVRLDVMDAYHSQLFMVKQEPLIEELVAMTLKSPDTSLSDLLDNPNVNQLNSALDIYQGLHVVLNTKLFMN